MLRQRWDTQVSNLTFDTNEICQVTADLAFHLFLSAESTPKTDWKSWKWPNCLSWSIRGGSDVRNQLLWHLYFRQETEAQKGLKTVTQPLGTWQGWDLNLPVWPMQAMLILMNDSVRHWTSIPTWPSLSVRCSHQLQADIGKTLTGSKFLRSVLME